MSLGLTPLLQYLVASAFKKLSAAGKPMGSSRYRGTKGDEDKDCNYAWRDGAQRHEWSSLRWLRLRLPVKRSAYALGAPLPEGVYFVNYRWHWRRFLVWATGRTLTFNIPVIAWSTPWQLTFVNGRIEAYRSRAGSGMLAVSHLPPVDSRGYYCRPWLFTSDLQPRSSRR